MQRFNLTDKHIKLLRSANISWGDIEYGAPAIDGKRPYGNGDVTGDIVRILFGDLPEETVEALREYAHQLHTETQTALQVILSAGSFEPGIYEADKYKNNWRNA